MFNILLVIFTYIVQVDSAPAQLQQPTLLLYGSGNGDTVINADDGIKTINIVNFPFFDKRHNTKIQLNSNGYITFGDAQMISNIPKDFPINHNGQLIPMIAVFWLDIVYTKASQFLYRVSTEKQVIDRVKDLVLQKYSEANFSPTQVLIVTWKDVTFEGKSEVTSSFQLILATDGLSTYTIWLYNHLPQQLIAGVGFQEKLNIFNYEYSLTNDVGFQLQQSREVDDAGIRVYRVSTPDLDASCKDLADGLQPDQTDCQRYYLCRDQNTISIHKCNESEHFHPEFKTCVDAAQHPCNEESAQNCNGKGTGLYPHSNDCKLFVQCTRNKVARVDSCPFATVFNPNLKVCVHENQYRCKNKNSVNQKLNFCDGKGDGNYPDDKSCNHFIICSAGLKHRIQCPGNLQFNPSTNNCDYATNVDCQIR